MSVLSKFWYFIVYSGSILALSGAGMVFAASLMYGVFPSWELLLVMFLTVLSSYNINRFTDLSHEDVINHARRTNFYLRYYKETVVLTALAIIVSYILAFLKAGWQGVAVLALFPVGVLLYSINWIPFSKIKRFKEIFVFKNVWVALIWGCVAAFLAASFAGQSFFSPVVLVVLAFIFLRFYINAVVFDMRDVAGDRAYNIITVPVALGLSKTKILLLIVNTLAGLFLIFSVMQKWAPKSALVLSLITFYSYYFLAKTTDANVDMNFLCDVMVDGEFILWAFLIYAGSLLF